MRPPWYLRRTPCGDFGPNSRLCTHPHVEGDLNEQTPSYGTESLLPPGALVGDQYQIVKVLGHGAMGSVFLATDQTLGRYVALKVLKPEVAQRFEGNARFAREARLLSRLSHPNIVTLHAFGTMQPGQHYIVMEYVPGESLEE
ncbi:MAG: protein kinase, partial [Myxococcota bacterium]|nr:protein kinase [Myxococcota bacterium]